LGAKGGVLVRSRGDGALKAYGEVEWGGKKWECRLLLYKRTVIGKRKYEWEMFYRLFSNTGYEGFTSFGEAYEKFISVAREHGLKVTRWGRGYPEELKNLVVEKAREAGARKASYDTLIPLPTVRRWCRERGVEPRCKRYSMEFKTEVVRAASELGINEASRRFGVNKKSVLLWCRKMGVKPKRRLKRLSEEIKKQIIELRRQGMSLNKIAKKLGVSEYTAYTYCTKAGL